MTSLFVDYLNSDFNEKNSFSHEMHVFQARDYKELLL